MRKNLAVLAIIIICFISIASGAFAMVPRIKFPKWNNTTIKITDWNPKIGILTLTVEIEADKIPIERAYSQPFLQHNFYKITPKYEKENIKQGEKVVFTHKLHIKSNTDNWLEMDVRAKPDIAGLKVLIRNMYSDSPTMRDVLEAEADQIKAPIFIGTSMPILARDDIALNATSEVAFTPTFTHKDSSYYIWDPKDTANSKTTNSAIKLFKEAIAAKNLKDIEVTGQNLISRFDTEKSTVVIKIEKGKNFSIPTKIVIEMLTADIACIKAVLSEKPETLEETYNSMKPSYTKMFVAYNLFALYKSLNKLEKAEKYKKEALKENPAGPLLLKE